MGRDHDRSQTCDAGFINIQIPAEGVQTWSSMGDSFEGRDALTSVNRQVVQSAKNMQEVAALIDAQGLALNETEKRVDDTKKNVVEGKRALGAAAVEQSRLWPAKGGGGGAVVVGIGCAVVA